MVLTRDNYYTPKADWEYMSCSQYQGFLECEAAQMAKLEGRWKGTDSEAFLLGNYFHSYMEGEAAHQQFCDEHFEDIFKVTKKGDITGKYAAYQRVDEMIAACMRNSLVRRFYEMPGEIEAILTGEIFGIPWRIRMDKYFPEANMILDWKTTANIRELKYNPLSKERETFMEVHGYLMRAAVYSEIAKQNQGTDIDPLFIIVAVSKQEFPDLGVFSLNHRQRWDVELEEVKKNLPRIMRVKEYREPARRCGECEYCRATNKVSRIIPYYELKPEFREGWEYDDLPEIPPEG